MPAPQPGRGEGEFVEAGSFRVDRSRAIEKLSSFRAPGMGPVLFWTRLACACGATRLSLTERRREIELRFDGLPLPGRALKDPYAALFEEEGRSTVQERVFALGIIHAWRPSLAELSVVSGKGGERQRMAAASLGEEAVSPREDGGGDTFIRLALRHADPGFWLHPVPAANLACRPLSQFWAPLPIERYQDDRLIGRVKRSAAGPGETEFIDGEVYGHLSVPDDPSGRTRIDVYHYGVLVGVETFANVIPAVVGKVDDRLLPLNASGSGLIRGERLEQLGRLIARRSRTLQFKVSREQQESLPRALALMSGKPSLHELWVSRVTRGPAMEAAALQEGLGDDSLARSLGPRMPWSTVEERASILREACVTLWLRDACQEAAGGRWPDIPADLRSAPIYFSRDMKPLCWNDLKDGALAFTESPFETTRCRLLREAALRG